MNTHFHRRTLSKRRTQNSWIAAISFFILLFFSVLLNIFLRNSYIILLESAWLNIFSYIFCPLHSEQSASICSALFLFIYIFPFPVFELLSVVSVFTDVVMVGDCFIHFRCKCACCISLPVPWKGLALLYQMVLWYPCAFTVTMHEGYWSGARKTNQDSLPTVT